MLVYRTFVLGNLTLLLCKTCGAIFYCFAHQHGRLITWMQTKNKCMGSPSRINAPKYALGWGLGAAD